MLASRIGAATWGPRRVSLKLAQLYTCHERPTLHVTHVSFPRLLMQNGTLSVMYPRARKGENSGSGMLPRAGALSPLRVLHVVPRDQQRYHIVLKVSRCSGVRIHVAYGYNLRGGGLVAAGTRAGAGDHDLRWPMTNFNGSAQCSSVLHGALSSGTVRPCTSLNAP